MKVQCRLCQRQFKSISVSHLKKHGYTMAQYREEFPDAPLFDEATRQSFVERNHRRWLEPGAKKAASEASQQSWQDPQVRKARVEGMKQAFATDEWKEGHAERMSERWRTDEAYRQRMTEVHQESWQGDRRRRTVTAMKRTLATPEQKQKRSEIAKERWKDEERNSQRAERMRERWKDAAYRKKVRGRRVWWESERAAARILTALGVYKGSHPVQFEDHVDIYTRNGRWVFNADFAAKSHRLVLHVDGFWYHHDRRAPRHAWRMKRDRLIDAWCQTHGWSFLRITDKELEDDPASCMQRIEHWVIRSSS